MSIIPEHHYPERRAFSRDEKPVVESAQRGHKTLVSGKKAEQPVVQDYLNSGGNQFPSEEQLQDRPTALPLLRTAADAAQRTMDEYFPTLKSIVRLTGAEIFSALFSIAQFNECIK